MAVTLWDYINADMNGQLRKTIVHWYVDKGVGTPTMAKWLNDMGYDVEQRTVWRWLKQEGITREGDSE